MKLIKLEIRGLFDLFDYDIPLSNPENLTIITGPNGFGKTMILNIIDSLFNKKFSFFEKLIFEAINVLFSENYRIEIRKNKVDGDIYTQFSLFKSNKVLTKFDFFEDNEDRFEKRIGKERIETFKDFLQLGNSSLKSTEDLIDENIKNKELVTIINSIDVHLIKEQRLLLKKEKTENSYISSPKEFSFSDTIQEYANELHELIKTTINQSFKISQELDSSFPKRLLEEKTQLNEIDFKNRFLNLKYRQEKLRNFGLTESLQEVPDSFISENAKVLLVYLNDSEKKSSVFDNLLERLELFTNILNNRRFTYKSIKIDKEKGFLFVTRKNKPLSLTELSSGEQHEVILLYELIFKAKSNTLVLIDEPEISLHVSWQKEFLNDLMKIIDLQKIQVVIATHSPQIINNRWDLTVDLEKLEE